MATEIVLLQLAVVLLIVFDWAVFMHIAARRCNWTCHWFVSLTVIGYQSVSRDTSGRLHLTCLEYAGDSTLYVGTSSGHVSAWDTRQNACFMHWQADTSSVHEIGLVLSLPLHSVPLCWSFCWSF